MTWGRITGLQNGNHPIAETLFPVRGGRDGGQGGKGLKVVAAARGFRLGIIVL